jgi:hypothetical protein
LSISNEIKRRQRDWAASHGIAIDRNGYVIDDPANLYRPLSSAFAQALGAAGGGELQDQRDRPAKIRALHSSAVLAINVFQYWEGRSGPELPRVLGADGELADVAIEQQFPSGLRGTPPTLDVVLSLDDARIIAVESKFTEWMSPKRVKRDEFRAKYLQADPGHWAACQLAQCQQLAADIGSGDEKFRQLDALQLLKHALGLAKNKAGRFALLYLYYDYNGESEIADRHRAEIERFTARVDASLGFQALSYQALFAGLVDAAGADDEEYIEYLRDRYF